MMCNEEVLKSTFDKYLFHLVCLGEKVQNCIKQIDEEIDEDDNNEGNINIYNSFKNEFKVLLKDIDVVFNESFTKDKLFWVLNFKERYLDFNKRHTDIALRVDIYQMEQDNKENSIDITENEARSDGGLEEEYLGTDEDEYENESL
jgi:hypothetical protein